MLVTTEEAAELDGIFTRITRWPSAPRGTSFREFLADCALRNARALGREADAVDRARDL